ncbi:MAG: hypothetical protein J6X58_06310 [Bacteroidales bacterium]|nr:hypothetical protein [Bacteroidales bacterium]
MEISIRNKEDLAIKGASAFFISNDNDTIKKISDSRGVIRIAFNTLSKHSRIYVNAANSVTDKYEEKIAYNTTIIDLHNLTTTNYRTNNHFAINKISVTLSHIKLNNTYYIIESQRPLDNKDIDCLRFDILLWKKNCAIWDVVTVMVCVDI